MKTYEEMAKQVLKRSEEEIQNRNIRKRKTTTGIISSLLCFSIVAVIGFAIYQSGRMGVSESEKEMSGKETSDEEQKSIISVQASYRNITKEMILNESSIIIFGKVLKQTAQYFTQDEKGNSIFTGKPCSNIQMTEYKIEVVKCYKGDYQEETITVSLSNGANLSKELFLYGEDDTMKLAKPVETYYLEEGQEYILMIEPTTNSELEQWGHRGDYEISDICEKDDDAKYKRVYPINPKNGEIILSPETLEADIATAAAAEAAKKAS